MEKSEFRVLIKYYFLRNKTITEVKAKLDKHFPDSSPSIGMIHKWFTEFRCGRASTEDAERPGRPNEVTTPEMINKIHDIVLNDPQVKVREIAETVRISTERVLNILHEHLRVHFILYTSFNSFFPYSISLISSGIEMYSKSSISSIPKRISCGTVKPDLMPVVMDLVSAPVFFIIGILGNDLMLGNANSQRFSLSADD